jgi:hypothetical protein
MLQRAAAAVWLVLLACGLAACRPTPQQAAEAGGDSQRVAVLEGKAITQGELDDWIKDQLFREQTDNLAAASLFELRSNSLQDLLNERIVAAEAEKQGISPDELLKRERAALGPISDEQVTDFYEKNKQRMGGATRDQVADRIRTFLDGQRDGEVKEALRKRANIEVLPEPPRITVAAEVLDRSRWRTSHHRRVQRLPVPVRARAGAIAKQIQQRYPTQSTSSIATSRSSASTRTPAAPPGRRPAPTRRALLGFTTTRSSPTSARWAPRPPALREGLGLDRGLRAVREGAEVRGAGGSRSRRRGRGGHRIPASPDSHAVLLRERDPALRGQAAQGFYRPIDAELARGLGSGARLPAEPASPAEPAGPAAGSAPKGWFDGLRSPAARCARGRSCAC